MDGRIDVMRKRGKDRSNRENGKSGRTQTKMKKWKEGESRGRNDEIKRKGRFSQCDEGRKNGKEGSGE